jgi:hypothetical protein
LKKIPEFRHACHAPQTEIAQIRTIPNCSMAPRTTRLDGGMQLKGQEKPKCRTDRGFLLRRSALQSPNEFAVEGGVQAADETGA